MADLHTLAASVKERREQAAALESDALDDVPVLVAQARREGVTMAELARLCGFCTRKPLYDALNRRGAG